MSAKSSSDEILVLTAYQAEALGHSRFRIEKRQHNLISPDEEIRYLGEGPLDGILVCASEDLPDLRSADASEAVLTSFSNRQTRKLTKERQCVHVWLVEDGEQLGTDRSGAAKQYLRQLLAPEAFPTSHTDFLHKAMVMLPLFHNIKRVQVDFAVVRSPTGGLSNSAGSIDYSLGSDDDSEDVVLLPTDYIFPPLDFESQQKIDEVKTMKEEVYYSTVTVMTPAVYDYQLLPELSLAGRFSVLFSVMAASDAYVALSAVHGDIQSSTYELAIGVEKNGRCEVHYGARGPKMAEKVTPKVLDKSQLRPFWISWAGNTVRMGRGSAVDKELILSWFIPDGKRHKINSIAVSTDRHSTGQWEFQEQHVSSGMTRSRKLDKRRQVARKLLALARTLNCLHILQHAFPSSMTTSQLIRNCKVSIVDRASFATTLKDFKDQGILKELVKNYWITAPKDVFDSEKSGSVSIVKKVEVSKLPVGEPSTAVITYLHCEKLAVDSMMDAGRHTIFLRHTDSNENSVYTIGRIGTELVVSCKLSGKLFSLASKTYQQQFVTHELNTLFATWPSIRQVVVCCVGGAVACPWDVSQHVRLGDVVLSSSSATGPSDCSDEAASSLALCFQCTAVDTEKLGRLKLTRGRYAPLPDAFTSQQWHSPCDELQRRSDKLHRDAADNVQVLVAAASKRLQEQFGDMFSRPAERTDKLFIVDNGQRVHVEHPQCPAGAGGTAAQTDYQHQPAIVRAAVASSRPLARNDWLRDEYARATGSRCYVSEDVSITLAALSDMEEATRSVMIVIGCSDYVDGRSRRRWQAYAALRAAGTLTAVLSTQLHH